MKVVVRAIDADTARKDVSTNGVLIEFNQEPYGHVFSHPYQPKILNTLLPPVPSFPVPCSSVIGGARGGTSISSEASFGAAGTSFATTGTDVSASSKCTDGTSSTASGESFCLVVEDDAAEELTGGSFSRCNDWRLPA